MPWEISFLQWLQQFHTPILTIMFRFFTNIGEFGLVWIALTLLLLFHKRSRIYGVMLATALILGLIDGNGILKNLIARPRPFLAAPFGNLLIPAPSEYSFPSGHTLASFEAVTVLFYYNRKWGIPTLLIAILIAFSRMYFYVHYPTDILGGIVLGIINGVIAIHLVQVLEQQYRKKKLD